MSRAVKTIFPTLAGYPKERVEKEIKFSAYQALKRHLKADTYSEIINDEGDRVRIYSDPKGTKKGSRRAPVGDNDDIKNAVDSIAKVKGSISMPSPILVSIVNPFTMDLFSDAITGPTAGGDYRTGWGFSMRNAGAHIIPDRIRNFPAREEEAGPYDPTLSWHSVPSNSDYTARSIQTLYHEIGHVAHFEKWKNNEELQADYKKYGLEGQPISVYGNESNEEHFAESFARYVETGDATPEFLNLLKSKGLLKSQQNDSSSVLSNNTAVLPEVSDLDIPTVIFSKNPPKPYSPKAGVTSSKDAKEKVLSALLDKVKSGEAPWRKPFKDGFSFAGAFVPRNPASKRVYSGLNSLVLKLHQQLEGYEDPRWMTYNQAKALGGQVRKGETGTPILVPFKRVKKEKDSTTGEEKVTGGYVTFSAKTVFNVAQIDGLNLPDLKTEAGEPKTPLEAQDFIIERYKKSMEAKGLKTPEINYTYVGEYGSHASSPNWRPSSDEITLPTKEQFNSPEDMFDTMTHELAHSTGHPTRLDRSELTKNYSSDNASRGKEELIAEIAAAILASMFGVNSDLDNTAAYVKSWLKALQDNPEMIIGASSDAQKVVDYLLGIDLGDWSPIEGYSTAAKSDKEEDE